MSRGPRVQSRGMQHHARRRGCDRGPRSPSRRLERTPSARQSTCPEVSGPSPTCNTTPGAVDGVEARGAHPASLSAHQVREDVHARRYTGPIPQRAARRPVPWT
eukprot:15478747-Alexandrium_andersonii.AAC.1